MRDELFLILRILSHVAAVVLGISISLLAIGVIVVALWGTGAFTTAPPPQQPGYLAALITAVLWFGAEALLYVGWKRLVRVLDAFEPKPFQ
jgi:hypothetical protein